MDMEEVEYDEIKVLEYNGYFIEKNEISILVWNDENL
jgi:hypothetical protein